MKKTVLITGASKGIGAACAVAFGRAGYCVAINYNKSADAALKLADVLEQNGIPAKAFQADVSEEEQVQRMVSEAASHFGRIDVLVNNAGISFSKLMDSTTAEEFQSIMNTNVGGVFHCSKAAMPHLLKRGGSIINVSSVWGICGASCEVVYSASKAAVIGFTKALAKEVGPGGVRVNCVAPGVVATDMLADFTEEDIAQLKEQTPTGRIGSPEDIAETVLFLACDHANFITGQIISPNGGFVI